jgi:hypothetical protein
LNKKRGKKNNYLGCFLERGMIRKHKEEHLFRFVMADPGLPNLGLLISKSAPSLSNNYIKQYWLISKSSQDACASSFSTQYCTYIALLNNFSQFIIACEYSTRTSKNDAKF